MRSTTAFLIGAITGALCVFAVQRIQEVVESGESGELADRMDVRLQELEDRLSDED